MSLYYNIIKINFIVGAMKSSHRVGNFIHCLHTVDQKASLVQQNKTLSVLAPNVWNDHETGSNLAVNSGNKEDSHLGNTGNFLKYVFT